ncbi:hypothetical protein [Picosynechococcus sp. PCC 7117]|uniref:hypothetical protein n=1 Tax=Picosynechococcus sp. PCC 7117 TaxID=195498 RepID=UPI0008105B45|nr:hypothetical protein [Picosynechococcus sp. PCC 7117]ANV86724.1 hypothetical protein AWQ22_04150 [Picosynechococcus sp. PCC 7117]
MNQAPPNAANASFQAALDNLDLDLDRELQRYRQQRPPSERFTPPPSPEPPLDGGSAALDQGDDGELMAQQPAQASETDTTETITAVAGPLSPWEQPTPPPEDYLQSSEELLKSLDASSQPVTPPTPRWKLGLAFLGAAILGGGLVALAIAVPDLFTPTPVPETAAESSPAQTTATTPETTASATSSTVNLASQEFIELRLDNLSIIDPSVPTDTENTEADATASTSATTPPPTPDQAIATPLAPVPGFPGTPLATPDGLKLGYYYVIFRNTSPSALERAQAVVDGAFVRQFPVGQAIQMAEVDSATKADDLMRQFKAQKIAAEVYYHQLSPAS